MLVRGWAFCCGGACRFTFVGVDIGFVDGNEVAISPRDLKNNDDSSSCTPRRVCESYSCNCYCCSSVANERCTVRDTHAHSRLGCQ